MMDKRKVYLDHAASTPVAPKVLEAMRPYFCEKFGNASSLHNYGQDAKEALNESRRVLAESIGAEPGEIIFTGSGTEANNFAIKGAAFAGKGKHIITTSTEHDHGSTKWLETQGHDITILDTDAEGFLRPENLEKAIRKDTVLVSIIHASNEIGTINNIGKLGKICKKHKVLFHIDACQSYTKVPIDVRKLNIDLMTINSQKIYGPKGVGALYIKRGTKITPWIHGGGHEFGLRSGTENIPGIVGFAKASQLDPKINQQRELQKYLLNRILTEIPGTILNGPEPGPKRLCNNINVIFKHIEGEALLTLLDDEGIAVSTASACGSHHLGPSHVLMAIGRSHAEANGGLRVTIGRSTTKDELDYFVEKLTAAVTKLRKISPFGR